MDVLKVLIAGDLCTIGTPEELILQNKSEEIIAQMKDELYNKDISIVNVEVALTEGDKGIVKSGPNLKCHPKCAEFVKTCGFDVACLANNHIGDYGPEAVMETIRHLQNQNVKTVGAGKNLKEANKILYLEKNNIKLAVLNYAEHEFGTASETTAGSAPLELFDVISAIKEAKEHADLAIVILHGGNERNPVPSPRMVKTYRGFVDAGASCVVNIHTHCPQGYEMYHGAPICYCPGNFLFHFADYDFMDTGMWTEGYLLRMTFSKEKCIYLEPVPYTFAPDAQKILPYQGEKKKKFAAYINKLSGLIQNKEELNLYWRAWCCHMGESLHTYTRNSDLNNGREDAYVLAQRNLYTCEAHHEVMSSYLRDFCDGNTDGLEEYWHKIEELQDFRKELIP